MSVQFFLTFNKVIPAQNSFVCTVYVKERTFIRQNENFTKNNHINSNVIYDNS